MSLPERITPAAVEAAQISFDEEDRAVVNGSVVTSLGFTAAAVGMLAPREWEDVADYLYGLLAREPLASSRKYAGQRIVLGNLASELRGYAYAADHRPTPTDAQSLAFHQHIDRVIAQGDPSSHPEVPHDAP